jgi:ABC-type transporter Mla subunit MlaD
MSFLDKAKDALQGKGDQVSDAIDKAADVIDDKTGGKHSDKIDAAADKAKEAVDKLDTSDGK